MPPGLTKLSEYKNVKKHSEIPRREDGIEDKETWNGGRERQVTCLEAASRSSSCKFLRSPKSSNVLFQRRSALFRQLEEENRH